MIGSSASHSFGFLIKLKCADETFSFFASRIMLLIIALILFFLFFIFLLINILSPVTGVKGIAD